MSKKKYVPGDNVYDRKFNIELYIESESYNYLEVIKKCEQYFPKYEYIIHDKDIYKEDIINEDTGFIEHEAGTTKKPHIHFVGILNNPKWSHTISNDLGIPKNFVTHCKSKDSSLLYLIHGNPKDFEKWQYSISELKGNLTDRVIKLKNQYSKEPEERINDILEYIEKRPYQIDFIDIARDLNENGLINQYLKNYAFYKDIIKEHNERYYRSSSETDIYFPNF